ncbi:MAG: HD-GYP domain-containing protein [Actinomycetota bacterium]|nr:HD-GYP domain-containing protein [Actinomycetota bacterium]
MTELVSKAIRMYVGTWIAVAMVFLGALIRIHSKLDIKEFLLFLILLVLAEAKPVRADAAPGRMFITVTFMVAVVAIIVMSPAAVAFASGMAVILVAIVFQRADSVPIKVAFNAAQSAVAAGLAAVVFSTVKTGLGGGTKIELRFLPAFIVATACATAIYFIINSFAVSGAVAIVGHKRFWRTWLETHGWLSATYVAFGASGLVLASLYQQVNAIAVPLLLVPLLVARRVFSSYDEVRNAYEETVRAFVSAIEAKDAYTRGHSERVADYSLMIARRLGIKDQMLDAFYYGALLHDVGKLVVRKAVLAKPSRLDEAEFDEIKRHPVIGAMIVREVEFLHPAIEGVMFHHERLDGSGYPAQLQGDIIPEWARIMAVADTYDAMTSNRAYRGARSHEEAVAELIRCSGTQLDSRCVELFIAAMGETRAEEAHGEYERQTVPRTAA